MRFHGSRDNRMRYFSMFSGIGGFELGIERAFDNRPNIRNRAESLPENNINTEKPQVRAECIGHSEIDKYAIKVYERQFVRYESCDEHAHISEKPEQKERTQRGEWSTDKHEIQLHAGNRTTPLCNRCKGHRNYGDATKINPNELPDFDLLVGGFPCQAFSIAGKRKGFEDTRGTLFFDIARILSEKRPRHLVLENVKGLLSHDFGKTFQTILGVLSDLGYGVEWQILNSKDFGVPQNRERIFIIGHLRGECSRKIFPITGSSQQIASVAGYISEEVWPRRHEQIRQVYKINGAMPTIPTGQGGGVMTKIYKKPRIRRLTPLECERLQGFPDDWTAIGINYEPISDTQRYKMCGNAVTVNVVETVMSELFKEITE